MHFFFMIEEMSAHDLSDLELFVLLAVLRAGENAYGVSIAREIARAGKRSVALGTVYAVLDRMEARGLVISTLGEATPARGGRSKRYFKVTRQGLLQVRATRDALSSMWRGIAQLQGGAA